MGQPLRIVLQDDMADAVRARVASGKYDDVTAVVSEGLHALAEREQAVEAWLRDTIVREYAAWEAGTLETVDLDDVIAEIELERRTAR